jgi:segregation and condensation protein A
MAYRITLPTFEGPFDLLLHLISRREIDIYDISLHEIAVEYLEYIEALEALDLEVASEFLLIAAILLKLKSDGLLPAVEPEGERLTPFEAREELVWRLAQYRKFRNAAEELMRRLEQEECCFYRQVEVEEPFGRLVPQLLQRLRPEQLAEAITRLLTSVRPPDISFIAPIKVNVQEFMERILRKLETQSAFSFRELCEGMALRIEVIGAFMALLELYKRDEVEMRQAERFGDIRIMRGKRPEPEERSALDGGDQWATSDL